MSPCIHVIHIVIHVIHIAIHHQMCHRRQKGVGVKKCFQDSFDVGQTQKAQPNENLRGRGNHFIK
jgi:hypothetical protein